MKFNMKEFRDKILPILDIGIIAMAILMMLLMAWLCGQVRAEEWTDTQIVEAIYKAEGGSKAQYLYGIRSVKYDSPEEARRICFNTVRNNRVRYADYGYRKYATYLQFLQSRYCPIGVSNDPQGLNRNWLKNVLYFLRKGRAS